MDKGGDVFLDQLARLGVINKVSTLAGPSSDDETEEDAKPEKVQSKLTAVPRQTPNRVWISKWTFTVVVLCSVKYDSSGLCHATNMR